VRKWESGKETVVRSQDTEDAIIEAKGCTDDSVISIFCVLIIVPQNRSGRRPGRPDKGTMPGEPKLILKRHNGGAEMRGAGLPSPESQSLIVIFKGRDENHAILYWYYIA
jgi:hypothetical protein